MTINPSYTYICDECGFTDEFAGHTAVGWLQFGDTVGGNPSLMCSWRCLLLQVVGYLAAPEPSPGDPDTE